MKFTAQLKLLFFVETSIYQQLYQRSRAAIPELVNDTGMVLLLPDPYEEQNKICKKTIQNNNQY